MVRPRSSGDLKQRRPELNFCKAVLVISATIGGSTVLLSSRETLSRRDLSSLTFVTWDATRSTNTATVLTPEVPPSHIGSINNGANKTRQRDFYEIAWASGTDKVIGPQALENCLRDTSTCQHPDAINPKCRVVPAHFYHTIYNKWLGAYSTDDAEPFQFLEIGFYNGKGYDAYKQFLPRAEHHSMEIACIEPGPREEGKVGSPSS